MRLNPITLVNFRLAGGWRQNAIIAGVYLGLVLLISLLIYRFSDAQDYSNIHAGFAAILGGLQGAFILMVAPSAVRQAVLRDAQTGMIESHRLSPMSNLSLVIGYLTGPTAQGFLLFLIGLVVGSFFAGWYGQSLGFTGTMLSTWYLGQLCLITLAFMVISLVVLISVASSGKTNIMAFLIILGVFGGWLVTGLVPGLALLIGAMTVNLLAQLLTRGGSIQGDPFVTAWAMVLQVVFGMIFICAACRRIRAPERSMFSIPLSLGLLAVSGVTLVVGWQAYRGFSWFAGFGSSGAPQWIGSTVAFMVVALLALVAAACHRVAEDRAVVLTTGGPPPALRLVDLLPLLLAGGTLALEFYVSQYELLRRFTWDWMTFCCAPALAIAASFWLDYQWIYILAAGRARLFRSVVAIWLLLKVMPLAIGGLISFITEVSGRVGPSEAHFFAASPIGTLILISNNENPWYGLILQIALAILGTVLALRVRRGARVEPNRRLA